MPAEGKESMPGRRSLAWASDDYARRYPRAGGGTLARTKFDVALPRPGGDARLSLDRQRGEARYELTDRGRISYLTRSCSTGRNNRVRLYWFAVSRRVRGRLHHLLA